MKNKMPWEFDVKQTNGAGVEFTIRASYVSLKATMFIDGEKITKGYLCDLVEFFVSTYGYDAEAIKKAIEFMPRSTYKEAKAINNIIMCLNSLTQI